MSDSPFTITYDVVSSNGALLVDLTAAFNGKPITTERQLDLRDPNATDQFATRLALLAVGRDGDWPHAKGMILTKIMEDVAEVERQAAKAGPQIRSARTLIEGNPKLRDPLIYGLLRRTEVMNVIGPSKTMKSYFVTHLQLSIACGNVLFGRYQVRQGDVLNLDNELHPETSASRIKRVAEAMGLGLDDYGDHFYVDNLRGRLRNFFQMGSYFDGLEPGRYAAIVLDAAYRFLPEGADENDNGLWTNIYNLLDAWGEKLQTSFIIVHHSSKGTQGNKNVTDVGAGAGAMSRAADSHLILRHHEEPGAVVVDAAIRSWEPIEPFCMRWEYPLWSPAPDLDPSQLKKDGKPRRNTFTAEPEEPKVVWTLDTFVERFIDDKARTKSQIVVAASEEGISDRKAGQFIEAAEAAGKLHRWTFRRNQPVRFATIPQPVTASGGDHG